MKLYWIKRPRGFLKGGPEWFMYCPERIMVKDPLTNGPLSNVSLIRRMIQKGEDKWTEYSQAPVKSIKGQIYAAGKRLMDKLPAQEKMWWRVESHMRDEGQLLICHSGDDANNGKNTIEEVKKQKLAEKVNELAKRHKIAWMRNAILAVPITILTVLPFVKLLLAWTLFRAVTHHRAHMACKFLSERISDAEYKFDQSVKNLEDTGFTMNDDLRDQLHQVYPEFNKTKQ